MYNLSSKSRSRLVGVNPLLVKVVEEAIKITEQDFMVMDGVRTLDQQVQLVARGASKTLHSKHLPGVDGFGRAVDLVPIVDGKPRWEWPLIYPIADAMKRAAKALGAELTWGGVWDRPLTSLEDSKAEVASYVKRHPGPDFIDGPHYELREKSLS